MEEIATIARLAMTESPTVPDAQYQLLASLVIAAAIPTAAAIAAINLLRD